MPRLNIENIRKPAAALYPVDVELRCVEVYIPDHDGYLWILAAFVAILGNDWAWLGTKTDRQTRAQLWQTAYAATLWDMCMKCEELQECLQPFFDAIQARFDALDIAVEAINQTTQAIRETQSGNAAKELQLPEVAPGNDVYAGALALVQEMDRTNRALYAEAEVSAVDNSAEWVGQILDFFPNFSAQGVGAGADLANAYFENQVSAYEDDYPDFEEPATCSLYCFITANDNVLTYDVWGDWLDGLDTLIPDNAPAAVYAKYSPLRQTFLNQIAALFNQEQSLQSYFDKLWNAYYTGTTNPIPVPPECECPLEFMAENVGVIGACDDGVISSVEFDDGVPFDVEAYEDPAFAGNYTIALKLPPGNWQVTLNSIAGTIVPPVDLNESAYAWIDTSSTWHNAQWNAPATPEDFGMQDTTAGIFSTWCTTQDWNAYLANCAPFTANFTVTAI